MLALARPGHGAAARVSGVNSFCENPIAVLKNTLEVWLDEIFLHEPAAEHCVFDFIADKGALSCSVRYARAPRVSRAFCLAIDEAMRRLPDRDLALPAQRDPEQAQSVIEQRALPNLGFRQSQDFEM